MLNLIKNHLVDYLYNEVEYNIQYFPTTTVKGSQFLRPYFEVSGACPGCGETPYYKLVSQLFGRDMLVANATGCSMIYCSSTLHLHHSQMIRMVKGLLGLIAYLKTMLNMDWYGSSSKC